MLGQHRTAILLHTVKCFNFYFYSLECTFLNLLTVNLFLLPNKCRTDRHRMWNMDKNIFVFIYLYNIVLFFYMVVYIIIFIVIKLYYLQICIAILYIYYLNDTLISLFIKFILRVVFVAWLSGILCPSLERRIDPRQMGSKSAQQCLCKWCTRKTTNIMSVCMCLMDDSKLCLISNLLNCKFIIQFTNPIVYYLFISNCLLLLIIFIDYHKIQ